MAQALPIVSRLFGSTEEEDRSSTRRLYRFVLGLTALMIQVFGIVYQVTEPASTDPLWARLAFSGVPLGILIFSYQSAFVWEQLSRFYRACAYLIVLWFTVLTYLNGFSPEYALGLLFVNAVTSAGYGVGLREMTSAISFVLYSTTVPIGAVWWVASPGVSPLLLSTCIVCLAGIGYPALRWHVRTRFEIETAVHEAKEAEEAKELKTALLANVTHEIRSPVATMIGYADTLEEEMEGPATMFTERIRESGQRLLRTVNSVLELSRMEAGSSVLSPADFDFLQKVRSAVQELEERRNTADVDLRCDLPDDPLPVHMDADGVHRIVRNLVDNAVKFTEDGRIEVRVRSEQEGVVLEVADEGIGISPEFRDHIFEAFQQESTGLAREYEGVGLGLAITHRIVTEAGGRIEVESEKGVGTTFTVHLPPRWEVGEAPSSDD